MTGSLVAPERPLARWVEATRPRTLVVAFGAFLVGTSIEPDVIAWRLVAGAVAAFSIQIAANFANDYFDAVRGVDSEARVGPRRMTASGLIAPRHMKIGIVVAFVVATVPVLALSVVLGPEVVLVWVACVVAAVVYSGGPRPVSSMPAGEVLDFVFFGVVATGGASYIHGDRIRAVALAASVPMGLLAASMLLINNLRDTETDRAGGRRTVAVRLGPARTRQLLVAMLVTAFLSLPVIAILDGRAGALLAVPAVALVPAVVAKADWRLGPASLIQALGSLARLELVFAVLLAAGLHRW